MTKEAAQEIFDKVIRNKTSGVISTQNDVGISLNNGINPKISAFLEQYGNNKKEISEKISSEKSLASSLFDGVK